MKKILRLSVILLSFACGYHCTGYTQKQTNYLFTGHYNIKSWLPSNEGLPNIYAMMQTPDGYLWIGNENGLFRFDGKSYKEFNRQNCKELAEDDCSVLFLSHDSSLICGFYNGWIGKCRDNKFTPVGNRNTFKGKSINAICEDDSGYLWIGLDGGGLLHQYSNDQFRSFSKKEGLLSNNIQAICKGKKGEIWIGTDEGLSLISEGVIRNFPVKDGHSGNDINALCMDKNGTLWTGSGTGNIFMFRDDRFIQPDGLQGKIHTTINVILEDPDGNLWIGTEGQGIFILDPVSHQSVNIGTDQGLSSDIVKCIIALIEGDIMVGTQGEGLNRIRKSILRTYTRADGLPEGAIMSVARAPNGNIWIGNETGGVVCYSNDKFLDFSRQFGIPGFPVFSLATDGNNATWAATVGPLIRFDNARKTFINTTTGLKNNLFHALCFSRDGTLWAGTNAGIYLIKGQNVTTLSTRDGLTDGRIFCFLEDSKGQMWVGTQEGGINIVKDGKIAVISLKDGLSDNMILSLFEDPSGSVWIGTGHDGLYRRDGKTGKIARLGQTIGNPRSVTVIMEDKKGVLWMGTSNGILSVARAELESFFLDPRKKVTYQCYREPEGMNSASCTGGIFPAGCMTVDGRLWFSTGAGITEVIPDNAAIIPYSLSTIIENLSVNNESFGKHESYNVSAGVLHLEVRYTAPSFIDPDDIQFRYMLEGYDKEWNMANEQRIARYTKVPPGTFKFRVQACNHYGQWSDKESSVTIHIKPYFYQSPWFYFLCFGLVLIILSFGLKYRFRQIREKELEILVLARTEEIRKLNEELEQKVVDRTAQLAASNTELEAFSYSVSHDLKAPVRRIEGLIHALMEDFAPQLDDDARDYLSKISESVTLMSQLIDELLKLSRIARQELEKADVDLSLIALKICDDLKTANPHRNVTVNIQPTIIADCDPRLLQIALQNLLDNAWKYTNKTPAAIVGFGTLKKEGQTLFFIRDNGVGFDMGHYNKLFTPFQRLHSDDQFAGTGIGLATVQRIILKHGGKIWAESKPGDGTTFYFTLL